MLQRLKSSIDDIIHLFLPHTCAGCGSDLLERHNLLCLKCLSELPATRFFELPGNPVEKMFYGRMPLRSAFAAYFFSKQSLVQHLLIELKYHGNFEVGRFFGQQMAPMIAGSDRFSSADFLIPLPLNERKERKRGYNQAEWICKGIAEVYPIPVLTKAIARKHFTETQTRKGRIERWQNMEGVFVLQNAARLQHRHVILVDDVVTTGATLEACALELLKVPGLQLSIATVAYTL